MNQFEFEIEQSIYNRFLKSLRNSDLIISAQDQWKSPQIIRRFDIVIYKGRNPLAVIEIKSSLQIKSLFASATDQVRSAITITNARFGIVTDNERFFLFDRNEREKDFKQISFDHLINTLLDPVKIQINKKDRKIVLNIIKEAANKHLQDNSKFLEYINKKSFLGRIRFDSSSNTFFFYENDGGISSFENQFFIEMMGEFKESKICRYTSLKTIFDMLNNISFRMSGIVGMNDKSEVNYVDSYLIGVQKPISKEHPNTIVALNKRYITSCTEIIRKDDLTLWRLYSDDAKGVCLVFNIKKKNLNNHVLLQKVKYADENGKHKELDFLKQIIDDVEFETGFKFEFRKIEYWKHFFKSHDYSIEDEVRLLIIDNDSIDKMKSDWVMTYTHSILNPISDFRLNHSSFPIHLSEIILGPKSPEQETNQVQLQEVLRRKRKEISRNYYDSNLNNVKVELSSIKHYR